MQKLPIRLRTIADLVPNGALVCDVGTDHGFLPIFLIDSGKAKSVIATDINEKPLKKARENIKKSGVGSISLRLCDGLQAVDSTEVDTVVVAGIGGEVISGILQRGKHITENAGVTLILQPTTSSETLRKYLYENGFIIYSETAVEENGKLYSVMTAKFDRKSQHKPNWFYFSGLVNPKTETGKKYLEKQKSRVQKCCEALKNISEKQSEYLYYKGVFEKLDTLINGENYGV